MEKLKVMKVMIGRVMGDTMNCVGGGMSGSMWCKCGGCGCMVI